MTVDAPPRPAPARRRSLGSGSTTPERLFRVALVLVVGCLATALVSVLAGMARSASVAEAQTRIAALTTDSAELYRSLADADAMATSGYVAGGREPTAVRARYDDDIARATDRLVDAAGRLPGSGPVATVAAQLPVYTGSWRRRARSTARGCRWASRTWAARRSSCGARSSRRPRSCAGSRPPRSTEAYERGVAIPFAVGALLVATLVAIVDVSLRERRRTHRSAQRRAAHRCGCAGGRVGVVGRGRRRGERPARDRAAAQRRRDRARRRAYRRSCRPAAPRASRWWPAARASPSDDDFTNGIVRVVGADGASGLLGRADGGAPGSADRITALRVAVGDWQAAHRQVRELDDGGRYTDAVASVVTTTPGGSGATFERLDAAFVEAIDAERAAFAAATASAASALTGLVAGPAVLALLAAAAVAVGLGRRIGEYR